jgi:purine-cytosine permease-like protein
MVLLGSALVPVGGVLLARLLIAPRPVVVAALYQDAGPHAGFDRGAMAAWVLGAVVYYAAAPVGGTVPSLLTATATALLLRRR